MVRGEGICHSNARESLKIKISGAKVEVSAFVPEGVEKEIRKDVSLSDDDSANPHCLLIATARSANRRE